MCLQCGSRVYRPPRYYFSPVPRVGEQPGPGNNLSHMSTVQPLSSRTSNSCTQLALSALAKRTFLVYILLSMHSKVPIADYVPYSSYTYPGMSYICNLHRTFHPSSRAPFTARAPAIVASHANSTCCRPAPCLHLSCLARQCGPAAHTLLHGMCS
ncbi:hypothetical protein M011DRAFT_172288 [Sporormia fimetaria CBS 119925]|uniref:Uncharacterized protein n=1 Tax=Sporormia fimetaria CBS 119925 TaxID=1340428 RepID=A0A6A6V3V0_9PLEO|nr:hypothetical protein M011DRAFT_172288 [Sporormia fimetaria CBS 119925]